MEAIIKIGEYNICCGCGKVRITCSLDEDGLPLCEACGGQAKKQYTKREIAIGYILRNRSLAIEDRLTLQEIADKSGIALSQVCYIYSDMADAPVETDVKG